MTKRHNHYAKADEKFIKATIIFNNGDDNRAFYDKECTEEVYTDEAVDLFLDRAVIYDSISDEYFSIDKVSKEGEYRTLYYSNGNSFLQTTKRPVEVNESNVTFYLEEMTLDGFEYNTTTNTVTIYRNKNRDFNEPITLKSPLVPGETYIVNWDGVEYRAELMEEEGGYYFGLNYYYPSSDEDLPFGLWFKYSGWDEEQNVNFTDTLLLVIATTPETSHTISIYK